MGSSPQRALGIPPATAHAGFRHRTGWYGRNRERRCAHDADRRRTKTQAQRIPAPAPQPRGILRPVRSPGLCREGQQAPVHRLHRARMRELPRDGGARMVRPPGVGHTTQRLRHRCAIF